MNWLDTSGVVLRALTTIHDAGEAHRGFADGTVTNADCIRALRLSEHASADAIWALEQWRQETRRSIAVHEIGQSPPNPAEPRRIQPNRQETP